MERQIKFRGKRVGNSEWVVGDLLHIAGGCLIYFGSDNDTAEPDIEKSNPIAVEFFKDEIAVVDPDSVGQFVGLKDSAGREIYEGDIIRTDIAACNFADGACGTVTFLRVVGYDEDKAGYYPFLEEHGMYSHYDWEIIGNMHDQELAYEGKKYKPLLVSDEKGVCEKCPLYGKCHLGFSNFVCEVFDGLQLLDDNKVVILQEIHDTPSLISDKR